MIARPFILSPMPRNGWGPYSQGRATLAIHNCQIPLIPRTTTAAARMRPKRGRCSTIFSRVLAGWRELGACRVRPDFPHRIRTGLRSAEQDLSDLFSKRRLPARTTVASAIWRVEA